MNIEHSYSAEDELVQERFMPKLEAENDELLDSTQDQDHQQANKTIGTVTQSTAAAPELEQQASIPITTNVTVPTTSINKRKMPLVTAEVDLFDDLEDDDLRFKGYCYTSTGADGSMSFNDSFGCPHCPAIFDSRVGLTNHSKLHGATKKMKCQLCDFSCTNKKTMRLHRRIHGIIPVRGRRANPDSKSAQKAAAAKRIKVEDLDDDGDETEEGEQEAAADHQANNRRKRAHPAEDVGQTSQQGPNTRRRTSKANNQDQGPGAVDASDVDVDVVAMHNPEEEPFVIITPNKRQRRQNNKKLSSRGGLEEEVVTSDGEEFSPKTRQQQAKERSQQSQNLSQRRGRKIVVQSDSSERPAGPGVSAPFHRHPGTSHHYSCPNCPYRTPQLYSLEQHMLGHSRPSGYVCSVCDYKHEYMRWLQTHCALHGNQAQWPPEYVYGNGEEAEMKQEKEEEEANITKQMGEKKPKTSTKKITPNARGMCQRFGTGGGRAGPSSSSTPIGY